MRFMVRDPEVDAACGAEVRETGAYAFVPGKKREKQRYGYFLAKRLFDFFASLFALAVLSPLFLVTSVLIRLDSAGPAIYSQTRVGRNGRPFTMYKFRSMCQGAEDLLEGLRSRNEMDGPVFKIARDPRVTRVGNFLRRTSVDELPQLVNILRGEMSLVGPRPPLPAEVERYTPYQLQRLNATPGLTCYWQIGGRSDTSFEEWVDLDLKYIGEAGVLTDLRTILKTVPAVLRGKGAY